MHRNSQRVQMTVDILAELDPSLAVDVTRCVRPSIVVVYRTITEAYFISGRRWLVANEVQHSVAPADIRVNTKHPPVMAALSILAASIVHELDGATRNQNQSYIIGEAESTAVAICAERLEILNRFTTDPHPDIRAHAIRLYNRAEWFTDVTTSATADWQFELSERAPVPVFA